MKLRSFLVVVAGLTLVGCEHFEPRSNYADVSAGMTREQVAELVGAPHGRHARGALEAWEYCVDGWLVDDHVVVWFDGSTVVEAQIELDPDPWRCATDATAFSWDDAPGG